MLYRVFPRPEVGLFHTVIGRSIILLQTFLGKTKHLSLFQIERNPWRFFNASVSRATDFRTQKKHGRVIDRSYIILFFFFLPN